MHFTSTRLPYRQAGYFNKIVTDYLDQSPELKDFFEYSPSLQGIQKSIENRKKIKTDRKALVYELKKQYAGIEDSKATLINIDALANENTFTITTAHQNNIFTGPLYFIYKILHTIKLANHCKAVFPDYQFVPVFYMGSEDADLAELNHIHLGGEKLVWNTKQTGAVGRMKADKELMKLIEFMEGQLTVLPAGNEIMQLLKNCYSEGETIQDATFKLLHNLFGYYGLVVLMPDNVAMKTQMVKLFEDEIINQTASGIVAETATRLSAAGYKVQAHPREINLFYLDEGIRNRIEMRNSNYAVVGTKKSFTKEELLLEINKHPERFSPNVILRGLYQETILPNIAFIGGGGELAYWLQLKDLFAHYKILFPVLVLRNSFLVVEKSLQQRISRLGFEVADFFLPEQDLLNRLVAKESRNETKLNGKLGDADKLYETIKMQASSIDSSLEKHVEALKTQSVYRLKELEKKMLRAEKRKFADQQRQIHTMKEQLFPGNGLQERHENISYYYAKWGRAVINEIYENTLALEGEFVILKETQN